MKLICTLFFLLFGILIKAQCIPDNSISSPGFYPPPGTIAYPNNGDTLYVMPYGYVGQAYSAVVQFKIPPDTNIGGIIFTVDSVKVLDFLGRPNGITYQCNNSNSIYMGGETGCVHINGTPTAIDSSQIKLWATFSASHPVFGSVTQEDTLNLSIYSVIRGNSSKIEESFKNLMKIYPNPSDDILKVELPENSGSDWCFEVTDLKGKSVLSRCKLTSKETHQIRIKDLPSGIYIYRLDSEENIIQGKFLVKH